jgi:hypothetical protein
MMNLSPYARLVLAHLELRPDQTLDELMVSTGCDRRATTRDTLKLLIAMGRVLQADGTPATYSLTPKMPSTPMPTKAVEPDFSDRSPEWRARHERQIAELDALPRIDWIAEADNV